jgi:hypothetical protein
VFSRDFSTLGVDMILSIPLAEQAGHFGSAMGYSPF